MSHAPLILSGTGHCDETPDQWARTRQERGPWWRRGLGPASASRGPLGQALLSGAASSPDTGEAGRGRGLQSSSPPTPAPAVPRGPHPCKPCLLAPHVSQTEVGGWSRWGPGARPAPPLQCGSLGCMGRTPPPTFPLLIRPPLLMRSYHPFSITPPEPSAPQHLAEDRGRPGCRARGTAEGGTPGWHPGARRVLRGLSAELTQLRLFISRKRRGGQPGFHVGTLRRPLHDAPGGPLQPTP